MIVDEQTNQTTYEVDYSVFGIQIGKAIFEIIHSLLRDFLCFILILNIMNLVEMKKAMAKKKTITGARIQQAALKASRAEKKDHNYGHVHRSFRSLRSHSTDHAFFANT